MSFTSYFIPTCETRELHADAQLRTHYYRNSFKQCLEALQEIQKTEDFEIRNVNEAHGEVYIISNGFDCILTMTQVTPVETGIDIKVNWFGVMGLGRPKKKALLLYKLFDKALKFKGVSLHP